jgi:hypothetical protein
MLTVNLVRLPLPSEHFFAVLLIAVNNYFFASLFGDRIQAGDDGVGLRLLGSQVRIAGSSFSRTLSCTAADRVFARSFIVSAIMSTSAARRHYWFRFGLVMILAIAAIWITHSFAWIRSRHRMTHETAVWRWPDFHSSAPGGLWLFGEPGYSEMRLWSGDGSGDTTHAVRMIRNVFPEAEVKLSHRQVATK